jgi:hypothetical protein
VTEGEAFTVERADLATADDVAELLEACDLGDGYENAGAWSTWLKAHGVESVTVLAWAPERAKIE